MGNLFSADAWIMLWHFKDTFILGFLTTIGVSLAALAISLCLGIIFGLMATSGKGVLGAVARVYVEFIQNTPLLLQICFLYYALSFSGNSIGIMPSGIISIGLYHGAYMAEVIRAGIQSINKGQFEAASSQGFNYFGTMYYIILPQSIKII
ncbi:MAG: amino acid ABC transporter permease, partial [Succinivibrio sp.]